MKAKNKKALPKKELPLVDRLCKEANPMAMRGILNFLLVCEHAGLHHIADDDEELLLSPSQSTKKTRSETYPLDADRNLIMMLSQVLVLPIFTEGYVDSNNIRKMEEKCYANPYFPSEGDAQAIYETALAALEEHGCVKRIGAPEGKAKAEAEIYKITREGTKLLSELVKKPGTIRNFQKEAEEENRRDLVQEALEGGQQDADKLMAGRLAREAAARQAQIAAEEAERAKAAQAERMRAEAERLNQKPVEKPAGTVVKKKKHSTAATKAPALTAEELASHHARAEHGILKFMQSRKAVANDSAIFSGEIKLNVFSRADQSGWSGAVGQNPYQSSFDVMDVVMPKMAAGDQPLIAADNNSVGDNKVYYYLTEAGMARLRELGAQAQSSGIASAAR